MHGCDPGRLSDGSRQALYQTLSIVCPSSIFFWHVICVMFLSFCRFSFCFCFVLWMLCIWVHGCDPGKVSCGSRLLALYQTLSNVRPPSIFFWHVLCVIVRLFLSFLFLFCFCFHALVGALCRCSCDRFLSSRPRTGLATTYYIVTGYG